MKYYKLTMDMDRNNDIVCYYSGDLEVDQNIFITGKYYSGSYMDFKFFYTEQEGDVLTDYLANDKGWFVVSEKLQNILKSLNTQIQFLPVRITEKNKNIEIKGYCIANILRVVDALCLDASDYFETEIPGLGIIYTVSKYGIYAERTEGSDIFKLSRRQEIPVFVSENFKFLVEKEDITGLFLREIKVVSLTHQ